MKLIWRSPPGLLISLMCDWLDPCSKVGNEKRIFVLSPASDDRGGDIAPEWEEMHGYTGSFLDGLMGEIYKGRCIFFENERCSIHDSGFKPRQCRENFGHDGHLNVDNYEMARLWDSDQGRTVVSRWRAVIAKAKGEPDAQT
jgi:hypothetical protein